MTKADLARQLIVAVLVLAPCLAGAEDDENRMDRLRAAVSRGDAQPLSELLRGLAAAYPGEVVDVEVEEDDGRFRYEFKVLQAGGRLLDVRMDAADGRIIDVEND